MQVEPFRIAVPDAVLADLRERLARTRFPDEIEGSGWQYGTNLAYLRELVAHWRRHAGRLHLLGLLQDEGVHAHQEHLFKILRRARAECPAGEIVVHPFLDGRDTPPDSGVRYVGQLQNYLESKNTGHIASICGRYYAMDRDTRWDRTEKAYRLYTLGEGVREKDPVAAVKNAYTRGESDEFICPVIITDDKDNPV